MAHDRRSFLKTLGCGTAVQLLLTRRTRAWGFAADEFAQGPFGDPDRDPHRPEYHLLPPHNWMNDPNGPIWWKGKYHLFYQLNPNAAVWGNMHWGHAISTDMVHWRHEPIALAPTPGGPDSEGCFSGSAVVVNGVPTVIYTGVQNAPPDQVTLHDGNDKLRETQLLATAEDDLLLQWKKQAEPVIAAPPPGIKVTGFRDPCPWREADGWYLGVGSGERGKGGCVLLYRSQDSHPSNKDQSPGTPDFHASENDQSPGAADFHHWEYLHKLAEGEPNGKQTANPCDSGEMWECPDFFELDRHHCLLYSTEGKVIWTTGDYDTKQHRYTAARTGVLDHGAYYAPKSFVAPDGRRILWGWIQETRQEVEFAAAGWAGVMSLPRELRIGAQGQLEMRPARETEALRGDVEKATLRPDAPYKKELDSLRQELLIPVGFSSESVSVRLVNNVAKLWELTVDVKGSAIRCGGVKIPLPALPWPKPEIHMFLDASVIESFIGEREAITSRVYSLNPGETTLEIATTGVKSLEVSRWALDAISPDRLTT